MLLLHQPAIFLHKKESVVITDFGIYFFTTNVDKINKSGGNIYNMK